MSYSHLRSLLLKKGKSQAALAEILNRTPAVVTNLFNGERQLKDWEARRISDWLEVPLDEVVNGAARVPIKGHVGAGGEVYSVDAYEMGGGIDYAPCPSGFNPKEVIALRIKGDSMFPVFQSGWIVYYSDRRDIEGPPSDGAAATVGDDPLQDFYNKHCVIKLSDGRVLLKTLKKGSTPGRFTLVSYNASDIENVQIEWAAKIISITTD